jgi:hypothetical protein
MANDLALIACLVVILWLAALFQRRRIKARTAFIRDYPFPVGLLDRLKERYPHLTEAERRQVAAGLRQFFTAYAHTRKFVSMPSQAADALWHEFILYTRTYEKFCRHAFGRFMHHTPAVVLGSAQQSNQGLHRVWFEACRQEGIDPIKPVRLPLLFALDAMLQIPGGFIYHPQCDTVRRTASDGATVYCAGDLGGASSGSDGDGGHADSDSGDSGGDSGGGGGGDGGSGCGGD